MENPEISETFAITLLNAAQTTTASTTTTIMTTITTTTAPKEEGEEVYKGITIGIVLCGLFLIVTLTCYVVNENRNETRRREQRTEQVKNEMKGDVPPTYSQIVLRQDPPEFKEAVMQEINPEENRNWAKDIVESSAIDLEVKNTVQQKVHSHAHGFMYNYLQQRQMSRSFNNLRDGMTDAELTTVLAQSAANQRSNSQPTFELGAPEEPTIPEVQVEDETSTSTANNNTSNAQNAQSEPPPILARVMMA